MGLKLQIKSEQVTSRILRIYDLTGTYNATSNPSGWGVNNDDPNPDVNDVVDVADVPGVLFMLETNGATYTYQDTTNIKAAGFPNATNQKIDLLASDFGLDKFPDGYYKITAKVAGNYTYFDGSEYVTQGFSSQVTIEDFFYAQAECCVRTFAKAVSAASSTDCFCDNEDVKKFVHADTLLEAIHNLAADQKWTDATNTLTNLQTYCTAGGGNCGC